MPAILVFLALSFSAVSDARGQDAPVCTTATSACTEWIGLGTGPQRVLAYRSRPLDAASRGVTRALILVHGGARNATESFRTVLAAAFLAGALNDTILIVPRFASSTGGACTDALASLEANWGCEDRQPDSWRNGSTAINNANLTSYDFIDEILRKLARKNAFPDLKSVVIAGHSGGGQFVLRYAMASEAPDTFRLAVTYVVANPDALVYFDRRRPMAAADPAGPFAPFAGAGTCPAFDSWPYGLQSRTGYTARLGDEQLKRQLSARPVTYLLGALDIFPIEGFDPTCPAMAQGPTRLARGLAYTRYLDEHYAARHKADIAPTCGHDERCVFTANAGLALLFPKVMDSPR